MAFHEVRFPTAISLRSTGGPARRTEVVVLGSGFEQRNQRWANSRRRYDAGYGVKTLNDMHTVIAFFEERRGRLHGFRWKDHADFRSCPPSSTPSALDQVIGTGDGTAANFQLIKVYGATYAPYARPIDKPVAGTVLVAVDGIAKVAVTDFTVNTVTGVVTFFAAPPADAIVTAGFEFDVPVRFDTDQLSVALPFPGAGEAPNVPVVEIRQ